MISFLKKYWDLIAGTLSGIILSIIAKLNLVKLQIMYSVIILISVQIGLFRIIKKEIEKRKGLKPRNDTVIDKVVNTQTSIKAVELGYHPMRMGEDIGYLCIYSIKKGGNIMKKLKELFDRFKGWLLATVLMVLSLVETFGGYIAMALGDLAVVNGVNMIALAVGICALIVALFSNTFTKEQKLKIKEMFGKIASNGSLNDEARKMIKDLTSKIKDTKSLLGKSEKEVNEMQVRLDEVCNTYSKKRAIQETVPDLNLGDELNKMSEDILQLKADTEAKKAEVISLQNELTTLEHNKAKLEELK